MNATRIKVLITFAGLFLFSSCGSIYPDDMGPADLNYNFQATENSKQYISMDYLLPEGSGIGVDLQEGRVGIIGDEGDFLLTKINRFDIQEYLSIFEKGEDMEDICFLTPERFFALRSDGRLYDITLRENLMPDSSGQNYSILRKDSFDTPLTAKNDAEGLCFDSKNKRLLIACKGPALIDGKNDSEAKAIYSFNLVDKKLEKKPVIVLRKEDLAAHLPGVKNPLEYIEPAAIALNPTEAYSIYLLIGSTPGLLKLSKNQLAEEGMKGQLKVKRYEPLDPARYTQPEGLRFLEPGAELLIVDEIEKDMGNKEVPATRLHILFPLR